MARPAGVRGPLPWARTDWGLAIAGLGLSLLGALLVWSSTRHQSGTAYLARHLVNTGIGMALAALVTRVDFRVLRAWAPWVYLVSVLGLVLVLSPVGSTINGSHSWIQLPGGFSVQPSEMAKIALCVGLAVILAERRERGAPPTSRDLRLAVVVAAVPIGLVMLQPDLGSALVLGALALGVVSVSGAPRRWVAGAVALVVAAITVALTTPVLSPYQRDRLIAFADPSADPEGIGYQTRQVRVAIGSGGSAARASSRAGRPRAGSSRSSRPTSSSRSRGRSSASSARPGWSSCSASWSCARAWSRCGARTRSAGWWPSASPAGSSSRCSRTSG